MGSYATIITEHLIAIKRTDVHPDIVEGWMRTQHPTLDHLDRANFRREVKIACMCHDEAPELSEDIKNTL